MAFNVGDVVKIRKDDLLRGGGLAKVMQVLPPRFEGWSMKVHLVCTSKRRVPENGILSLRTWASSIVSPVLIRRIAFNRVSGFM